MKLKADPNIKQLALSKGILLPGKKNGSMNFDLDYTHAYDDLRKPAQSYRRVTGQWGYSKHLVLGIKPFEYQCKN